MIKYVIFHLLLFTYDPRVGSGGGGGGGGGGGALDINSVRGATRSPRPLPLPRHALNSFLN